MYRKRFYAATFPWIWCCCLGWWVDRLLVEMGHRSTFSNICMHNDLQYVHQHQFITSFAILVQFIWIGSERKKQFLRENTLLGVTSPKTCIGHLYILLAGICVCVTGLLACIFDVSPWLCIPYVLEWRASLVALFGGLAIILIYIEQVLYTWSLKRGAQITEI
jgi:hypothetical protein